MEHFKRSTARDFRINGATLEAALREESSDEEEDDELNADEQDEVSLNQRILATIITRREERWVELTFPKTSGTGEKLANRSADRRVSSNDRQSPSRFSSGRVCELCLAEWFGRWVITLLPQIVSLESELTSSLTLTWCFWAYYRQTDIFFQQGVSSIFLWLN